MATWSKTSTSSKSESSSQSHSESQSTTKKVLDEALLSTILGGLTGRMSREEIAQYAENLLAPQLHAGLEAAAQEYEAAALSKRQEIDNLAAQLTRAIGEQNAAYKRSMADVETAALRRGMGRSSYTLESLAGQGELLSKAVMELTRENEAKTAQIQAQISQAADKKANTQARLKTDYAAQLAAKMQEIEQEQRREQNSSYLTAVSAAMGSQTTGSSDTTGKSQTSSSTKRTTTSGKTGSSGSSSKKKTADDTVDAISGAAPSVKRMTGLKSG